VPVAYAADITVDDGVVAVLDDGKCSLREAILSANTDAQVFGSAGECAAGSGADTINLAANGSFALTNAHSGMNGLPVISSTITIEGNGATIARSGAGGVPKFRILAVNADGDLTLRQATISGGDVTNAGGGVRNSNGKVSIEGCTLRENASDFGGGGVSTYASSNTAGLTISNSTIISNTGGEGGGVWNHAVDYATAEVAISNTVIVSNTARIGGGVYNVGGHNSGRAELAIEDSTISGNSASERGGGVYSHATNHCTAELTIESSTVSGNTATEDGGGVWNSGRDNGTALATIEDSTVSGNTATDDGGGIHNMSYTYYDDPSATVFIRQCTISGNDAGGDGGGVKNDNLSHSIDLVPPPDAATVNLSHATVSDNAASRHGGGVYNYQGTVDMGHIVLSGNAATQEGNEIYNHEGVVNAGDHNLFGHGDETDADAFAYFAPTVPSDINATKAPTGTNVALADILDPLTDNGGPTETHALFPGSPAIDAGNPGIPSPPEFDQRGPGFPRVAYGVIDIGAYEVQEPAREPVGGATVPPDGLASLGRAAGALAALIAVLGSGVALTRGRTI
jgi:CSLREA domain-containing protein